MYAVRHNCHTSVTPIRSCIFAKYFLRSCSGARVFLPCQSFVPQTELDNDCIGIRCSEMLSGQSRAPKTFVTVGFVLAEHLSLQAADNEQISQENYNRTKYEHNPRYQYAARDIEGYEG